MTSGASLRMTSEEFIDGITLALPWIEARTELRSRDLPKWIAGTERQQPRRVMSILYRSDATRVKRPPGGCGEADPFGNARHERERAASNGSLREIRGRVTPLPEPPREAKKASRSAL